MRLARRWNRHVTGAMHEEGAMHSIAVAAVLKTLHAVFLDHARRQICLWLPRIPISIAALPAPSGQGSFLRCQTHSELIQPRESPPMSHQLLPHQLLPPHVHASCFPLPECHGGGVVLGSGLGGGHFSGMALLLQERPRAHGGSHRRPLLQILTFSNKILVVG
jgi:hypothetical protein